MLFGSGLGGRHAPGRVCWQHPLACRDGVASNHTNRVVPLVSDTLLLQLAPLAQAGPGNGVGGIVLMVVTWGAIGILFYWLLIMPQRKERNQREGMLANLKKNDRVVTVGGIYGVVTNVQRDADEVTIKVDESTNTKLRVTLGAIARVIADKGDSSAESSNK
jgi:preprotein translocase subunit YajC